MPPTVPSQVLHYDAESQTFTCELSDIRTYLITGGGPIWQMPHEIAIQSARTKQVRTFRYDRADQCGADEDAEVGGWWYRNTELGVRFLVIND